MLTLNPREYFTIVRVLGDPLDSGTYYVRAVIRNAKTDALIETVDLEDKGDRRFSMPWQVPADSSGEGFYIVITTTVYTDSGYSSVSANYTEEAGTYLIQDRYNHAFGGHGGGPDIDYKRVRKIVQEELGKLVMPEMTETDLMPLLEAVSDVKKAVQAIDIPKPETFNYAALNRQFKDVLAAVSAIEIPEPEKLDLNPVLQAITEGNAQLKNDLLAALRELGRLTGESVDGSLQKHLKEVSEVLEAIKTTWVDNIAKLKLQLVMPNQPAKENDPKPKKKREFLNAL